MLTKRLCCRVVILIMWLPHLGRRTSVPVLLLCILYGGAQSTQPNIVVIVADDLGWNDVGYRNPDIKTPNIDMLAAAGVKLDNYYVQPVCTPSRAALLTGKLPINLGMQHKHINPAEPYGLPLNAATLAEVLKTNGYVTHMVGKWHLGFYNDQYTPTSRGFDHFYGLYTGSANHFTHRRHYIPTIKGTTYRMNGMDLNDGTTPDFTQSGIYSTDLFNGKAIDMINAHDANKPFFLYMSYQAPHTPLQVPKKYEKQYVDAGMVNEDRITYSGMVSALDEAVAELVIALDNKGLWDDTILVFTTDNGGKSTDGGNNYPLRGWKTDLWEGGIRGVSFVVSPLYSSPVSSEYDGLVHISDWFPTLLNLAGGNTTGMSLDSFDMWDAIFNDKVSPRTELLHNIDPVHPLRGDALYPNTFDTRIRAAFRDGKWKLVTGDVGVGNVINVPTTATTDTAAITQDYRDPDQNLWLFDIDTDEDEEFDVSGSNSATVLTMLDKMKVYYDNSATAMDPDSDPNADPVLHGDAWKPWL